MITYVNTVLVSNKNNAAWATASDLAGVNSKAALANLVGKFVFMNCDPAMQDGSDITDIYAYDADVDVFKIGVIKNDFYTKSVGGQLKYIPIVKWSNEIKVADIKSMTLLQYQADTEDVITVDFNHIDNETLDLFAAGGIPVILRLTFKDTPTRYRKWSESYDFYTTPIDKSTFESNGVFDSAAYASAIANNIAVGLADTINKQTRRARVIATVSSTGVLELEAMPYDDDNSNDSENCAAKVRFNANCWYSNPQAAGFASNNKYAVGEISKTPGVQYPASAKLVRDHERTAQGYEGILHRCCWYDPKPAIVANIDNKYNGITLEFENMYRAADDIFRKTKQTVEIYGSTNGEPADLTFISTAISGMIANRQNIVNKVNNSQYGA